MASSFEAGNLFSVKGLVAVITGGGSGIGLMMTKALASNGAAKIYIIGRRKQVLEDAAKFKPDVIVPVQGDVTSKESLASIESRIKSEVGYINLVVANSGIVGPSSSGVKNRDPPPTLQEWRDYYWEKSVSEFSQTFEVNVSAVFFTTLAFLPLLEAGNKKANVEQKSQVITTSSIAGYSRQQPAGPAYGPSKAAVTHLMKQLSTVLIPYDIRFNVIAPGFYPSDLAGPVMSADGDPQQIGGVPRSFVPLQRIGRDDDMAGSILYLASRAGAYVNGNVVVTDGGRLSALPASY